MANVSITVEFPEGHVPRIRKALELFTSIPEEIEQGEPPVKVKNPAATTKALIRETIKAIVVQQERQSNVIEPPTVT